MTEQIKPCPFCYVSGKLGKNHVPCFTTSADLRLAEWWIECPVCGGQGPSGETREEAVQAWNHRPHEVKP